MERDSDPIDTVKFIDIPTKPFRRVRSVDWLKVLALLDSKPGVWALIGEFDQSMRTHINNGRFAYIDPNVYEAAARKVEGNRANIFMRKRAESA